MGAPAEEAPTDATASHCKWVNLSKRFRMGSQPAGLSPARKRESRGLDKALLNARFRGDTRQ